MDPQQSTAGCQVIEHSAYLAVVRERDGLIIENKAECNLSEEYRRQRDALATQLAEAQRMLKVADTVAGNLETQMAEAIVEGRRMAKEAISSREIDYLARITELEKELDSMTDCLIDEQAMREFDQKELAAAEAKLKAVLPCFCKQIT